MAYAYAAPLLVRRARSQQQRQKQLQKHLQQQVQQQQEETLLACEHGFVLLTQAVVATLDYSAALNSHLSYPHPRAKARREKGAKEEELKATEEKEKEEEKDEEGSVNLRTEFK